MASNVVIAQKALCIQVLQADAKDVLLELLNFLMNSLKRKVCAIHVALVTTVKVQDREVVVFVRPGHSPRLKATRSALYVLVTQLLLRLAALCALSAKTERLHMTVSVVVLVPKGTDTRVPREAVA
jgi:hypothetical protein